MDQLRSPGRIIAEMPELPYIMIAGILLLTIRVDLLNVNLSPRSRPIHIKAMIIIIINISIKSRRPIISIIIMFMENITITRSIIIHHPGHITITRQCFIIRILVNSITIVEDFTDMTGVMVISRLTCQLMFTSTPYHMDIEDCI